MGEWLTLAAIFGPGIALGIWLGWRGGNGWRAFALAAGLTFLWGMGVWFVVFGAFATPAEMLRISAIAVGVAVINAGLPFGAARLIKRTW